MATYSTRELRRATEAKIGRSLSEDQWDAIAPDWSDPYDEADLTEVLDKLGSENQEEFEGECARLSWVISRGLEKAHERIPDHAQMLKLSSWSIRPLGEFWAWSWFYPHKLERGVLTQRQLDTQRPDTGFQLTAVGDFTYESEASLVIMYYWEFFWKAVSKVASQFNRGGLETISCFFWPSTWGQMTLSDNSQPEEFEERRAEFRAIHLKNENLPVGSLRKLMEQRICKLYRDHLLARTSFGTSDPTKQFILMASSLPNLTWEQKRQIYERLRSSSFSFPPARPIASWRQFAVEAKRVLLEFPKHHSRREHRDDYLYEIGPRWTRGGDPLPKPR